MRFQGTLRFRPLFLRDRTKYSDDGSSTVTFVKEGDDVSG